MWFCDVSLLEREVSPADRARDPEAEGAGRGARPGDQGVAGEAEAQEEGTVVEGVSITPFSGFIELQM